MKLGYVVLFFAVLLGSACGGATPVQSETATNAAEQNLPVFQIGGSYTCLDANYMFNVSFKVVEMGSNAWIRVDETGDAMSKAAANFKDVTSKRLWLNTDNFLFCFEN